MKMKMINGLEQFELTSMMLNIVRDPGLANNNYGQPTLIGLPFWVRSSSRRDTPAAFTLQTTFNVN